MLSKIKENEICSEKYQPVTLLQLTQKAQPSGTSRSQNTLSPEEFNVWQSGARPKRDARS